MAGLWMVRVTQREGAAIQNPFINVFGFRNNLTLVNEEFELWNSFQSLVAPKMLAIESNVMTMDNIDVLELNGTRQHLGGPPIANVGLRSGEVMPNFVAWAFRLNRAARGTRHGHKRIGAISEADVLNGALGPGMSTLLNDFADIYGTPLLVGAIQTFFPVILHRPIPPATLWTDSGAGFGQYVNVSSQNTRKR